MALVPFAVLWMAYQLGWYGYATIAPWCGVGFMDLMIPGQKPGGKGTRMAFVESVISGKGTIASKGCGGGQTTNQTAPGTPPPASGIQNCPPGQVWVGDAANGGCVQGTAV